jgi:hypothetical protein
MDDGQAQIDSLFEAMINNDSAQGWCVIYNGKNHQELHSLAFRQFLDWTRVFRNKYPEEWPDLIPELYASWTKGN